MIYSQKDESVAALHTRQLVWRPFDVSPIRLLTGSTHIGQSDYGLNSNTIYEREARCVVVVLSSKSGRHQLFGKTGP